MMLLAPDNIIEVLKGTPLVHLLGKQVILVVPGEA